MKAFWNRFYFSSQKKEKKAVQFITNWKGGRLTKKRIQNKAYKMKENQMRLSNKRNREQIINLQQRKNGLVIHAQSR